MNKGEKVVINSNQKQRVKTKIFIIIALVIVLGFILFIIIRNTIANNIFADESDEFAKLNNQTIFSVNKVYMYSSAGATQNNDNRPIWNLNISQYTDIALYINNNSSKELSLTNSVKELKIGNVKFNGVKKGTPELYYKNVYDFGKFTMGEENKIEDTLNYEVLLDGEIDYSKPQVYADLANPITLSFVNKNIIENKVLSDISADLKYDGTLLRKSGIILSDIKCNLSFTITIINNYNQEFVANVYLDIPIENTNVGTTIYDGKMEKTMAGVAKFYRMK